ncbi:MAG TPA: hypothetical protein VGQ75_03240 [Thermoanaerobaculia bacterium]|nr:hypothetical protein [Thermoanaerobaculia bacterium]
MTSEEATPSAHKSRVRRNKAWNLALAIFFFILGFIGLLIPVMPQFLFFAMGILFLSFVSPTVRRGVRRFLHAHPKLAHAYKRWRDKGRRKRRELIRRRKELVEKLHLHRKDHPESESPPRAAERK